MKTPRVLVGFSGGIDSAYAAQRLKDQGYDVTGLFLDVGFKSDNANRAAALAEIMEIDFCRRDVSEAFRTAVVEYFLREYAAGRTPNPCVVCNRAIKFAYLLHEADAGNIEFIATGHYARVDQNGDGRFSLLRGVDHDKDQSYFLYRLDRAVLSRLLLPNGQSTKAAVRRWAEQRGLATVSMRESQEICFVPDDDYRSFIESSSVSGRFRPGNIVTKDGTIVGRHRGIHSVTIGQRRGLGIASERPFYVLSIDRDTNTVMVGRDEDQYAAGVKVRELSWIDPGFKPRDPFTAVTRIRYRHRGVESTVTASPGVNSIAEVLFLHPQKAVAPGQSAVFYDGDRVLGGGIIESGIACE
ncbi:MAG TPA: tRNA 2-thiouridine(34) synthase MnmA [Deltaproteobacteria bacterium]|nr:tRNA 2-thiouridine(34) synthase MnmA [Deltaproteobacteria bacterium]